MGVNEYDGIFGIPAVSGNVLCIYRCAGSSCRCSLPLFREKRKITFIKISRVTVQYAIGKGVIGFPYSQGAADGMQAENMESYYSVRYAMAE